MEEGCPKKPDPHAWSVYRNLCRVVTEHEIRTAEKILPLESNPFVHTQEVRLSKELFQR